MGAAIVSERQPISNQVTELLTARENSLSFCRTYQLLDYADNVNLLADNVNTIKKNTETLINASKEACLEINVEKTKYMFAVSSPECRSNRDIKTANR
jgi:uncharacterized phage infection (PIP) family protein YhgE